MRIFHKNRKNYREEQYNAFMYNAGQCFDSTKRIGLNLYVAYCNKPSKFGSLRMISSSKCEVESIEGMTSGYATVKDNSVQFHIPGSIKGIDIVEIQYIVEHVHFMVKQGIDAGKAWAIGIDTFDFSDCDLSNIFEASDILLYVGEMKVILPDCKHALRPISLAYIFSGGMFDNSYINYIISKLDCSDVTSANSMFENSLGIYNLDFSGKKFLKLNDTSRMFKGCRELESVKFDVGAISKSRCADDMFRQCCSLVEFDMTAFDGADLDSMDRMFYGCESLQKLDVDCGWGNILKIGREYSHTTMYELFFGCNKLRELKFNEFVHYMHRSVKAPYNGAFDGTGIVNLDRFNGLRIPDTPNFENLILELFSSNRQIGTDTLDLRGYRLCGSLDKMVPFDIVYYVLGSRLRVFKEIKNVIIDIENFNENHPNTTGVINEYKKKAMLMYHDEVEYFCLANKAFGSMTNDDADIVFIVDKGECDG